MGILDYTVLAASDGFLQGRYPRRLGRDIFGQQRETSLGPHGSVEHENVCVVFQLAGDVFVHPVAPDRGTQSNFPQGKCILQVWKVREYERLPSV